MVNSSHQQQHQQQVMQPAPSSRPKYAMLGPYRLLRTIGEGEFGKVKLAVHTDDTAEVAIKLIKKENIETPSRRSKLLREISILQSLDHPYIVKLIEVIETDHYIGMVMEFASGGELFEYILAHRYLKEKDACRVFAQLLAGVSFIHSVGIVHRDLKLENLLLDSNGNIIITDFGFANKSRNGDSDLLQTSCGSPCYAAPELVISDGYVGEAADIWSCGVILYAMLCGYLPYDDDPDNPDSDNINLLYKYILETELEFPDYISSDARSLLKRMLVPDPKYRAKMPEIMSHRWLAPAFYVFEEEMARRQSKMFQGLNTPPESPAQPGSDQDPDVDSMDLDDILVTNNVSSQPITTDSDAVAYPPVAPQTSATPAPPASSTPIPPLLGTPADEVLSSAATPRPPSPQNATNSTMDFSMEGPTAESNLTPPEGATPTSDDRGSPLTAAGSAVEIVLEPSDPKSPMDSTDDSPANEWRSSQSSTSDSKSQEAENAAENQLTVSSSYRASVSSSSVMTWFKRKSSKYPQKSEDASTRPAPSVNTAATTKSIFRSDDLTTLLVDDNFQYLPPSMYSGRIIRRRRAMPNEEPNPISTQVSNRPDSLASASETSGSLVLQPIDMTRHNSSSSAVDSAAPTTARTSVHAPSISASDYNNHGVKKPRKLKFHSGPIDKRALTSRDPDLLLVELEDFFLNEGYEVLATGDETGEYKLKILRPQQGEFPQLDTSLIDEESLSALAEDIGVAAESFEINSNRQSVGIDRNTGRTTLKERKRRAKGATKLALVVASLPVSLAKRIRYIAQHGPNFNKGFDGRTVVESSPRTVPAQSFPASSAASVSSRPKSSAGTISSAASDEEQPTGVPAAAPASSSPPASPPSGPVGAVGSGKTKQEPKQQYLDEIKFNVEIERVKNVPGMYVVDFKRLRGDIWAFKRLYHKLVGQLPLKDDSSS